MTEPSPTAHPDVPPNAFTPVGSKEERAFLEGPHSRWREFVFLTQVMREFLRGLRKLHFVGPCVTVFGSARFNETQDFYKITRELGRRVAQLGFTIMTGGGPGLMEAANRGARDVGGCSIGCNIRLPKEQQPNPYLDKWVTLDYFFVRKNLLSKYSYAFIVMPGGFGTMDEFFEALTLIQTGKYRRFPVVLFGTEYHKALYAHMQNLALNNAIDPVDLKLFLFTDSIDEAVEHIRTAIEGFGLRGHKKALSVLGESEPEPAKKARLAKEGKAAKGGREVGPE